MLALLSSDLLLLTLRFCFSSLRARVFVVLVCRRGKWQFALCALRFVMGFAICSDAGCAVRGARSGCIQEVHTYIHTSVHTEVQTIATGCRARDTNEVFILLVQRDGVQAVQR